METRRLLEEIGTLTFRRKWAKKTLAFTVNYCRKALYLRCLRESWLRFCRCRPLHCAKIVRIRSFSGPYSPAFRLCIQSEWGKIRTRKTPNMDTFNPVMSMQEIIIRTINSYYSFMVYPSKSTYSVLEQESPYKVWYR